MNGDHKFNKNYAENAGGAIKWDNLEPIIQDAIRYENNSATLYGNDIACFAQNLILISEQQYN